MKLSEKIQEALREQQEINLSDPAVADAWKGKCERLEAERDALHAKIEAMERQVPICRAEDLRYAENLLPALGLMPEDKLYALPGAKGE